MLYTTSDHCKVLAFRFSVPPAVETRSAGFVKCLPLSFRRRGIVALGHIKASVHFRGKLVVHCSEKQSIGVRLTDSLQ